MKSTIEKEFIQVFHDLNEHLVTQVLKPSYIYLNN